MNEKTYDAIIIGGGLTGLLTTYALSSKGFNVAIVDKSPFNSIKNIKLDFRTTAISEGSKIFLDKIGIWQKLGRYSEPIKKIIVYDRDESNKTSPALNISLARLLLSFVPCLHNPNKERMPLAIRLK